MVAPVAEAVHRPSVVHTMAKLAISPPDDI